MKVLLLPLALSALVLASCAPSTPDARIAARPAVFEALPSRHQALVRQGRIEKGMGTEAVTLAWGRPGRVFEGSEGGAATLRWDYLGSTPVHTTSFSSSFGYGRYGRHHHGFGFGPEIVNVPYVRATVLFRNGRVSSWERSR